MASTVNTTFQMDDDDDAPPMLVGADNTSAGEAALSAEMGDAQIARVPITVITGMRSVRSS